MRGTDVTEEQFKKAEDFLEVSQRGRFPKTGKLVMERDQVVRLLAWYGELVKSGDGSGNWVANDADSVSRPPGTRARGAD